ncbi:MAG: glycosyl transferase [[Eubacterium] sulci]|jgi:possible glycosyltransferase|nr:glycosyl transferase [[Eubacterium] sulci]
MLFISEGSLAIPIYCANLPQRTERKMSIIQEFEGRKEFSLHVCSAVLHEVGAVGLWQTFLPIVRLAAQQELPYFIFCEDDHVFTADYDRGALMERIRQAEQLEADVLSGGVSWMKHPIEISSSLFWVEQFNGMQFTVIFQRFYDELLALDETEDVFALDFKISELSDNIFVMHPFISVQKEFGYSDVTSKNAEKGYVESLFAGTSRKLNMLKRVKAEYKKRLEL